MNSGHALGAAHNGLGLPLLTQWRIPLSRLAMRALTDGLTDLDLERERVRLRPGIVVCTKNQNFRFLLVCIKQPFFSYSLSVTYNSLFDLTK